MNNNWGKTLKDARIKCNLSQKDLAVILNVDRTTIAKYERMDREPQFSNLAKLAVALNLDLNELIIGKK